MGTASRVRLAVAAWLACAAFGCGHSDQYSTPDPREQAPSHPEDEYPSREDIQDQRARSFQRYAVSQAAGQPAR